MQLLWSTYKNEFYSVKVSIIQYSENENMQRIAKQLDLDSVGVRGYL
jgi:hypothetical protein